MHSHSGLLTHPLPALDDPEGDRVPSGLPPIVDTHVHLFPDRLFEAIWSWFDQHGWPIRYKLYTPQVIEFLLSRGVSRFVALHYAHKPGMSRMLNAYIAGVCVQHPQVLGLATVFPGEPDAPTILEAAFAAGLKGVKLHCHVQCFAPDDPKLDPIYEVCASAGKTILMHAGREPKSPAYACDPHQLCSADRIERVLQRHPRLRLCVPHLGATEFAEYHDLLRRYDTLWLDTTMAIADYLPGPDPWPLVRFRPERILYGTDFPNIPYAWDRELRRLVDHLPEADQERVLGTNALELFQ